MTEAITVSELSRRSGISRTTIHRALADGRLSRYVITTPGGRRMLEPEALAFCTNGGIRPRSDSPWADWRNAPATPDTPQLEHVAAWANAQLDIDQWSPPPWPAHRWHTLISVWNLAADLAEEHGEFDPQVMAELEAQADG